MKESQRVLCKDPMASNGVHLMPKPSIDITLSHFGNMVDKTCTGREEGQAWLPKCNSLAWSEKVGTCMQNVCE